jgi:hypothetical protein
MCDPPHRLAGGIFPAKVEFQAELEPKLAGTPRVWPNLDLIPA